MTSASRKAERALQCPATRAAPIPRALITLHRPLSNGLYELTCYCIDRVPRHEWVRCGLDVPDGPARHRGSARYERGGNTDSKITIPAVYHMPRHSRKCHLQAVASVPNYANDRWMAASAVRLMRVVTPEVV